MSAARFPAQARASTAASNAASSGSGPSCTQRGVLADPAAANQVHHAEAPRIVERDDDTGRQLEDDVVVGVDDRLLAAAWCLDALGSEIS